MNHTKMLPYLAVAAVAAAVLFATGMPLAPFALLLVCPLMMVFMMRGMSGSHSEDHTGHGCEHDPTRKTTTSTHR